MGIHLSLVDFMREWETSPSNEEYIIVNDIRRETAADLDAINQLIYTSYEGDVLSTLPRCLCGKLKGKRFRGIWCNACSSHVKYQAEASLESLLWVRRPDDVQAIINPNVWLMLTEKFSSNGFDTMQWVCNSHYGRRRGQIQSRPPAWLDKLEEALKAHQIERSYNSFVENFDRIMEIMFDLTTKKRKRGPPPKVDDLFVFLVRNRHLLFTELLPLPNRALLVLEKCDLGNFLDTTIIGAINAIQMLVGIDDDLQCRNPREKQNRLLKAIVQLSGYYRDFYRTSLQPKTGIIRRHVIGTRVDMSFRTVVSSLQGRHRYDEIHIPWTVACQVLREHVMSVLLRDGYSHREATELLHVYAQEYHPVISQVFDELIRDATSGKGIPVAMQRNPSLERGSIQLFYITKVKTYRDNTTSFSPLTVKGFNAI